MVLVLVVMLVVPALSHSTNRFQAVRDKVMVWWSVGITELIENRRIEMLLRE